ncbi:hypothetical protein [uncultured Bacteroides sp.]|uniref:hypothetical protein n=1 Tax=uncultured Bacteroides sp. TaxID=162156 RepID=UPI0025DDA500|nr:hypothetical protein [uncultured Bacteroides sp.]
MVRKYEHSKKCYIWGLVDKAEHVVIFFYDNGSRGCEVFTEFGDAELKSSCLTKCVFSMRVPNL